MKIVISKGKYILAVSGGVDSMVLLHLLMKQNQGKGNRAKGTTPSSLKPHPSFVVAHFNHGIRPDSNKDEKLVIQAAKQYGLELEVGRAKLGPNASEETARKARYAFLEKAREKHGAKAIITAHHQDDLIETALINTLRGTKRRGLTAISDNPKVIRPLLKTTKKQIIAYAKSHKLKWHEDSTNKDESYLRNFLRTRISKLTPAQLRQFSVQLDKAGEVNRQIDQEIAIISQLLIENNQLKRQDFANLPADISREVMNYWLRREDLVQADRKLIDRAANFVKTGLPGASLPLCNSLTLKNGPTLTTLWKA